MNILVLTDGFFPEIVGGISKSLLVEIKGLIEKKHQVVVLTRMIESVKPYIEQVDGIRIYRHRSPLRQSRIYYLYPIYSMIYVFRNINRIIKKEKIDIINAHYPFPALAALANKSRIPLVYTYHAPIYNEITLDVKYGKHKRANLVRFGSLLSSYIESICLKRSSKIIARSSFTKEILTNDYGLNEEKIVTIPLCVDIEKYKPLTTEKKKLREYINLPREKILFLTVRRLEARMGLDNLLDAIKILSHKRSDLLHNSLFLIGGKGHLYNNLKKMVKSKSLEKYIIFLGFIPEDKLVEYYNAVDYFVLPTQALEGFGLSTIESLACGTPVIGTPIGATPEILMKIDERLIFKGKKAEDIASGIETVLNGRIEIDKLRKRGRMVVKNHFSKDVVINQLESEYYKSIRNHY
jgi:glycosyltransferase involved in cell wall biosynthesis